MSETDAPKRSWAGIVISGIPALFLSLDAVGKLVKPDPVIQATVELGYPETLIVPLGIVLLVSVILYAIPKTSVLGAILLTGYLGGAVATHVRLGSPLLTHQMVPVFVGVMVWLGLYLRESRLRGLTPLRN